MSDYIDNNEQNLDLDDNQDAPNQANDSTGEEFIIFDDPNPNVEVANEAEGNRSALQQPNFSAIVDYYLLSKRVPQRPIGLDIKMTHKIETKKPINITFTGGEVVSITTGGNQTSVLLQPPHDPGRVRVQINSLAPTPRFPIDPLSCKPSGQFRCGICLIEFNQLANIRTTTCGHIYCDRCLEPALSASAYCPICGESQEYENSVRLFWCGHNP